MVYLWCYSPPLNNREVLNIYLSNHTLLSEYSRWVHELRIIDCNYYRSSVIKQFDLAKDVQWNYEMVSGKS